MLKAIIADDEFIVREGLRSIVSWEDYGIEIIGEAPDGQEAFELCMEYRPDILLTDIRMPFLDGLEVAAKLKESGMDIKVIIFSGVQDFGYAKTAVKISAEAYVLKPLEVEELKEALQKVTNKINEERDRELRFHRLKQQLHENIGVAQEKFLRNLVLGVYKNEKEIIQKMEYFNHPFKGDEAVSVAVLEIDDYSVTTGQMQEEDKQLLIFAIKNIVDELIGNYSTGISFYKDENEIVILFDMQKQSIEKYNTLFLEISSCLKKYLQISVSIGIGYTAPDLLTVHSAYKSAVEALQYKFYTGKETIVYITDIETDPKISNQPDLYEVQLRLINLMKVGDIGGVEKSVTELLDQLALVRKNTIEHVQEICAEIIFASARAIYEMGEKFDEIVGIRFSVLEEIYRSESIYDLKDIMAGIFGKVAQHYAKKHTQKNKKVILDIKAIIEKDYKENLSVNRISDMVYLTPNYISLIFKQETGVTITDYVTKVRMERAKELLKTSDLKVLDVSEQVGYEDASYFSKVFKKYTGVYPQKYRSL